MNQTKSLSEITGEQYQRFTDWIKHFKDGEAIRIPAEPKTERYDIYISCIKKLIKENRHILITWSSNKQVFKKTDMTDMVLTMTEYMAVREWLENLPKGEHEIPHEPGLPSFAKYVNGIQYWKEWAYCTLNKDFEIEYFYGESTFLLK